MIVCGADEHDKNMIITFINFLRLLLNYCFSHHVVFLDQGNLLGLVGCIHSATKSAK